MKKILATFLISVILILLLQLDSSFSLKRHLSSKAHFSHSWFLQINLPNKPVSFHAQALAKLVNTALRQVSQIQRINVYVFENRIIAHALSKQNSDLQKTQQDIWTHVLAIPKEFGIEREKSYILRKPIAEAISTESKNKAAVILDDFQAFEEEGRSLY